MSLSRERLDEMREEMSEFARLLNTKRCRSRSGEVGIEWLASEDGESLIGMATNWRVAAAEERRDILWALVSTEGLMYDLERWALVGIRPRTNMLPALALGLAAACWEQCDDELWLREDHWPPKRNRPLEHQPPTPQRKLSPEQCEQARVMVEGGMTLRQVAAQFGVSYMAIWRVMHMQTVQLQPQLQREEGEET